MKELKVLLRELKEKIEDGDDVRTHGTVPYGQMIFLLEDCLINSGWTVTKTIHGNTNTGHLIITKGEVEMVSFYTVGSLTISDITILLTDALRSKA